MKSVLGLFAGLLLSASTFGQGQVSFNNVESPNYRLWTNGPGGTASNLMSGVNAYRIGLYAGPNGASEASLTLVGLATNASPFPALAGYFNGGRPYTLPAGYTAGVQIAFQLRAWEFGGGLDYATAIANPAVATGKSPIGFTTPTFDLAPGALFGTRPGQLSSGFEIGHTIPEPSTWALAVLGVITAGLFLRRPKPN